jgi:hypothetical protein
LDVGDLSNKVARNGDAVGPTNSLAISISRESVASFRTAGTLSTCRAPAFVRSTVATANASPTLSMSVREKTWSRME